MNSIPEDHKLLLKALGLSDGDLDLFDGEEVTYEFDDKKGVRLYDPEYCTSYDEYIDVDGWSAWSSENDTFMSDILKGVDEKIKKAEKAGPGPTQEDISATLKGKLGGGKKNK